MKIDKLLWRLIYKYIHIISQSSLEAYEIGALLKWFNTEVFILIFLSVYSSKTLQTFIKNANYIIYIIQIITKCVK